MNIAIIGTGIAGLTAAWMLQRSGANVQVFERMDQPGFSGHGIEIELDQQSVHVDVPPRFFNSALWPKLTELYRQLELEIVSVDLSKSFGRLGSATSLSWNQQADNSFSLAPFSWKFLADLLRASNRSIFRDLKRMSQSAAQDLKQPSVQTQDFEAYLDQHNYSDAFRQQFLFPLLATTVCTCSYDSLKRYPTATILTAMLALVEDAKLFRVRDGASEAARRLLAELPPVRFNTPIRSVRRNSADSAAVQIVLESGEELKFDQVVMATQANTAARLVTNLSPAESTMLNSFQYETVNVAVHRDDKWMPLRREAWSHFNFLSDQKFSSAMCTVWMNRFYSNWQTESNVFQTITPIENLKAETLICQRQLQRPVVNQRSLGGLQRLEQLHAEPDRRIWFCGSYACAGVPLLESGVASAMSVAEKLTTTAVSC